MRDVLENDRLRNQYYECFMDREPCTTAAMKFYKGTYTYPEKFFVSHFLNSFLSYLKNF